MFYRQNKNRRINETETLYTREDVLNLDGGDFRKNAYGEAKETLRYLSDLDIEMALDAIANNYNLEEEPCTFDELIAFFIDQKDGLANIFGYDTWEDFLRNTADIPFESIALNETSKRRNKRCGRKVSERLASRRNKRLNEMEYRDDMSPDEYRQKAWSGAASTLIYLEDDEIQQVFDYIEQSKVSGEIPTLVEINDFFWFKLEEIANLLGYNSWEDLVAERL